MLAEMVDEEDNTFMMFYCIMPKSVRQFRQEDLTQH